MAGQYDDRATSDRRNIVRSIRCEVEECSIAQVESRMTQTNSRASYMTKITKPLKPPTAYSASGTSLNHFLPHSS